MSETNNSQVLRTWAEQLASKALEAIDPIESAKLFGKAWELSESAYRQDGNKEPRQHEDFLKAIQDVIYTRNRKAVEAAGRL